jgi:hypothetical protein
MPRLMFSSDFFPSRGMPASAPVSSARSRSASEAMPSSENMAWAVFMPMPWTPSTSSKVSG